MTESIDNLVLEHLRAMRADMTSLRDDVREVKNRLSTVEAGQGAILQHIGHLTSSIAQQQVSFDRLSDRVERIERRLNLVDAS